MEASIDKYNKQVSRQKEDVLRWKKRYIDFNKELTVLQNEINSSVSLYYTFISIYIKLKLKFLTEFSTVPESLSKIKRFRNGCLS